MKVDTSIGDVVDKVTILQIKSERLNDKNKLANVNNELELLLPLLEEYDIYDEMIKLRAINETIWEIEDNKS